MSPKPKRPHVGLDLVYIEIFYVPVVSRRPAHSTYLRLTHKPWASYGYALGLSDWRLVSGFDCVGTPE